MSEFTFYEIRFLSRLVKSKGMEAVVELVRTLDLNTSSPNDARTKLTDARFGGSGADDVLCADVPSSPKEEQLPSCPDGVAESAASDQDGAKPSTSVQPFDRKCPDTEPAGTGREGGKPSTSFRCACGRKLGLSVFGDYIEISFSSGKGEHSPSGDAGRGKSGVHQNLPLANPRPEESIVGWPRNEAEAAAWGKAKRSYIQNVTPEKDIRSDERSKVLDEVEAKIQKLKADAEHNEKISLDPNYQRYFSGKIFGLVELLGAMRK